MWFINAIIVYILNKVDAIPGLPPLFIEVYFIWGNHYDIVLLLLYVIIIIYVYCDKVNINNNNKVDGFIGNLFLSSNSKSSEMSNDSNIDLGSIDSDVQSNSMYDVSVSTNISTTLTMLEAKSLFESNKPVRLYTHYHGIGRTIISNDLHKYENICIGVLKVVYHKVVSENILYIGSLLNIHNNNTSFYIGDIIKNNNINYNIFFNLKVGQCRLFTVPHVILYNYHNNFGIGLNDIVVIPHNDNYSVLYDNINDMNFIHKNITLKYYGYLLNNKSQRNNSYSLDINRNIIKKYLSDINRHNNSSSS